MNKYIILFLFFLSTMSFGQKVVSKGLGYPGWYVDKVGVERQIFGNPNENNSSAKIQNRLELAKYEKNRILNIKKLEIGDLICGSEVYWNEKSSEYRKNYTVVEVKGFVEQKSGNKYQIRITDLNTKFVDWSGETERNGVITNKSYGFLDEYVFSVKKIKIIKNGIFWIDPVVDFRWYNCEL